MKPYLHLFFRSALLVVLASLSFSDGVDKAKTVCAGDEINLASGIHPMAKNDHYHVG